MVELCCYAALIAMGIASRILDRHRVFQHPQAKALIDGVSGRVVANSELSPARQASQPGAARMFRIGGDTPRTPSTQMESAFAKEPGTHLGIQRQVRTTENVIRNARGVLGNKRHQSRPQSRCFR